MQADPPQATVGLVALCAQWFREVGLQGESGELADRIQQDYERAVRFLSGCFDRVVASGVISTIQDARRAAREFRQAPVDALFIVHLVWSEDQPLLELLHAFAEAPVLLWNYHPTGTLPRRLTTNDLFRFSGTVGLLQGSSPMQRLGRTAQIVCGSPGDAELAEELRRWNTALRIRKEFQGLAAGLLGGRCEPMTGTYVDEHALRKLGVHLVVIPAKEYAAACEAVALERIESFHAKIVAEHPVEGVSEPALRLACRNTLALDDLVEQRGLKALAIQDLDPELHRLAGIRPCLCPPASAERGVAFGMEADLNTTLGMLAAMRASGAPCMYTEVFTFDPKENLLLMGHAGVHDPRLAGSDGVTIVPDAEYRRVDRCEGAWQEFILVEGLITVVSLYDTGKGYRMVAFEAESLGPPRRLSGFAHAAVRPSVSASELVSRLVHIGMTQHFAIARGRVAPILAKWCGVSGIEFRLES